MKRFSVTSLVQVEREPGKRRIKPSQHLLDFEDLGESSDDSDFRIEDHEDGSEDDSNFDSDGKSSSSGSDSESEEDDEEGHEDKSESKSQATSLTVNDMLSKAEMSKSGKDFTKIIICCVCLGDTSSDQNEIIECDCCGVTVHEGCYGVPDSTSVSSSESSCSTEPWFCEACRAGVESPVCELCPNTGGIFKGTDVGKWVHLVCALYVPGVAFGEVDKLSNVTLFELPFSRWGSRICQHCPDSRLARTGVCIQCDAGMCRTYFHVTCGQREGLLTEANAEEVIEQADPFYAHCKLHCDKTQARIRKRNFMALQFRSNEMRKQKRENVVQNWERIQRKLNKYRAAYATAKGSQPQPWIPTQKRPRLLTSSANACRLLWKKAECMGIDTATLEAMDIHIAALMDVPKKWHLQPAFSVEFVGYFLDRNSRIDSLKKQLATFMESNTKLLKQQETMQVQYDQAVKANTDIVSKNTALKDVLKAYHNVILAVCPNKKLPDLEILSRPAATVDVLNSQVASATKASIGYPPGLMKQAVINKNVPKPLSDSPVLLNSKCGICQKSNDQHLLAKCDTCRLFYHLGCLNPPLTRMPKKSKLFGWQCSECDKESSGSEPEITDPDAPRKLRQILKDSRENSVSKSLGGSSISAGSLPGSPEGSVKKPTNGIVKKKPAKQPGGGVLSPNSVGTNPDIKPRKPRKKRIRVSETDVSDSDEPRRHIKIFATGSKLPDSQINASSDMSKTFSKTIVSASAVPVTQECSVMIPTNGIGHAYHDTKKKTPVKQPDQGVTSPSSVGTSPGAKPRKKRVRVSETDLTDSDEPRQPLKIFIKSIPSKEGNATSPQLFIASANSSHPLSQSSPVATVSPSVASMPSVVLSQSAPSIPMVPPPVRPTRQPPKPKAIEQMNDCDTCSGAGNASNMVSCDECKRCFHFGCLDPPVKKSPKVRGYSWHCANCDPTESDSDE